MKTVKVLVLIAAMAACVVSVRAQQAGRQYFVRGSNYTPVDSIVLSDGTLRHWFIINSDTVRLTDSLEALSSVIDTVSLRGINTNYVNVFFQYKTRGQETGADTAAYISIRPVVGGLPTVWYSQSLGEEYTVTADSVRNGWWTGRAVIYRDAAFRTMEVVTYNPDATPIDSLRVGIDSQMVR